MEGRGLGGRVCAGGVQLKREGQGGGVLTKGPGG